MAMPWAAAAHGSPSSAQVFSTPAHGRSYGAKFQIVRSPAQQTTHSSGGISAVKVAVRVRPLTRAEKAAGCKSCLEVNEHNLETNEVAIITADGNSNNRKKFRFDNVFGAESTQEEVYRKTALPLVERCLDGFNATVLAYGQTGSGKTWTVGNTYSVNGAAEDVGIIPRAVEDIFKRLDELRAEGVKASVHASFLEVYNEEVKDLIGFANGNRARSNSTPLRGRTRTPRHGIGTPPRGTSPGAGGGLQLRETPEGEISVLDLSQHEIADAQDLGELLKRGAMCRATASTSMNARSSRSHAICTLSFEVVRPGVGGNAEDISSSKFHLVDLAGSEGVGKTGIEGKRRREGIHINKGLLVLRKVISALSKHTPKGAAAATSPRAAPVSPASRRNASPAPRPGGGGGCPVHVPYRESKLTRLLQSSLGGNSNTVMIACVSPADRNMAESLNTLRYAESALNIKNTAIRNEGILGAPTSSAEVMSLRKELRAMQVELAHARFTGLATMGCAVDGGKAPHTVALEEAAELRRKQTALERRVSEAMRQATAASEAELSARMESDRWRLQFEQLSTVVKGAAPSPASLGGVTPSWYFRKPSPGYRKDFSESEHTSAADNDSNFDVREKRAISFGGEGHPMPGSVVTAWADSGTESGDSWYSAQGGAQAHAQTNTGNGSSVMTAAQNIAANETVPGNDQEPPTSMAKTPTAAEEELRETVADLNAYVRVLESKLSDARETATDAAVAATVAVAAVPANAARIGRAVTNVSATAAEPGADSGSGSKTGSGGGRKLRSAKRSKSSGRASGKHNKSGRGVFWCEKNIDAVNVSSDTEDSDVGKRRGDATDSDKENKSSRDWARGERAGQAYAKYCAVKEAKKAEIAVWLAAEIEEAASVERAKHALNEQLALRGQASDRAQELRGEQSPVRQAAQTIWSKDNKLCQAEEEKQQEGAVEISELELRIAASSKVIRNLQAYLVSADGNSSTSEEECTKSGKSRWSRLRTPWEIKAALSFLMAESVKAKLLRMGFVESLATRDAELHHLSREVAALRLAAADPSLPQQPSGVELKVDSGARDTQQDRVLVSAQTLTKDEAAMDDTSAAHVSDENNEPEKQDTDKKVVAIVTPAEEQTSSPDEKPERDLEEETRTVNDDDSNREADGRNEGKDARSDFLSPISRSRWTSLVEGDDPILQGGENISETTIDEIIDRYTVEDDKNEDVKALRRRNKEAIDWDNLDYYTVEELERLLQSHRLPVSGPKDVLIRRLRTTFDVSLTPLERQHRQQQQRCSPDSAPNPASFRPPPKTYDFSSESEMDLSFSSTLTTPNDAARHGGFNRVGGKEGAIKAASGEGVRDQPAPGGDDGASDFARSADKTERQRDALDEDSAHLLSSSFTSGDDDGRYDDDALPTTSDRLSSSTSSSSCFEDEEKEEKRQDGLDLLTAAAEAAHAGASLYSDDKALDCSVRERTQAGTKAGPQKSRESAASGAFGAINASNRRGIADFDAGAGRRSTQANRFFPMRVPKPARRVVGNVKESTEARSTLSVPPRRMPLKDLKRSNNVEVVAGVAHTAKPAKIGGGREAMGGWDRGSTALRGKEGLYGSMKGFDKSTKKKGVLSLPLMIAVCGSDYNDSTGSDSSSSDEEATAKANYARSNSSSLSALICGADDDDSGSTYDGYDSAEGSCSARKNAAALDAAAIFEGNSPVDPEIMDDMPGLASDFDTDDTTTDVGSGSGCGRSSTSSYEFGNKAGGRVEAGVKEMISWNVLSDDEVEAELAANKSEEDSDAESDFSADSDYIHGHSAKSISTTSTSTASMGTTKSTSAAVSAPRISAVVENDAVGSVPACGSNGNQDGGDNDVCEFHPLTTSTRPPKADHRDSQISARTLQLPNAAARPFLPPTATTPPTTATRITNSSSKNVSGGSVKGTKESPLINSPPKLMRPISPRPCSPRCRPAEPLLLIAGDSDMDLDGGSMGSFNSSARSSAAKARMFFQASPLRTPDPLFITTPTSAGSNREGSSFRHPSNRPL